MIGNEQQRFSGKFDTLPTFEVPKAVLEAALKATQPIGNGLHGVDVKEKDGKGFVIEVNDNPSIDRGVEDLYCVVWKTVVKVINSYASHINYGIVAVKERPSFINLIDRMEPGDVSNLTDLGVMR